jgi:hypothetical protein
MKKQAIPPDIQTTVQQIVDNYNKSNKTGYMVSFKGKYCYLSRMDNRGKERDAFLTAAKMLGFPLNLINQQATVETKIGRLEWTGDMENWGFAVFLYSKERYDDGEALFFMPGGNLLDGTIEGAMRAGHKIYP